MFNWALCGENRTRHAGVGGSGEGGAEEWDAWDEYSSLSNKVVVLLLPSSNHIRQ